jgi:hypothetical protein
MILIQTVNILHNLLWKIRGIIIYVLNPGIFFYVGEGGGIIHIKKWKLFLKKQNKTKKKNKQTAPTGIWTEDLLIRKIRELLFDKNPQDFEGNDKSQPALRAD